MKKAAQKKKKISAKKTSTERGKSKILILVIALVLFGALGGAYIFSQKTGVAIPGIKAPLNPNCKQNDPELCKFLNNWQTQSSYAVSSTGKFQDMSIESMYEIAGTDKFHMLSKLNGKENSNVITIGDTNYTLDYTDNKWWKQTYKAEETKDTGTENEMKNQFDIKETEDTTTYKFITKEACGDLTCFKYQMIDDASAGATQYMWFDDKEYLMRKMRVEDKENGSTEAVYTYGNINISTPSPVKEGSPTAAGGAGGYSEAEAQKMMKQYQQTAPVDTTTEAPLDDTSSYEN